MQLTFEFQRLWKIVYDGQLLFMIQPVHCSKLLHHAAERLLEAQPVGDMLQKYHHRDSEERKTRAKICAT